MQYPQEEEEDKDKESTGEVVGGEAAAAVAEFKPDPENPPVAIVKPKADAPPRLSSAEVAAFAEAIYEVYPRKAAKESALRSISKAVYEFGGDFLLAKTTLYAEARRGQDPQYTPHPATWFNQHRFNDDPAGWSPKPHVQPQKKRLDFQP